MFFQRETIPQRRKGDLAICLITKPVRECDVQECQNLFDYELPGYRSIGDGIVEYKNLEGTVYGYIVILDDTIIGAERFSNPRTLFKGDTLYMSLDPVLSILKCHAD